LSLHFFYVYGVTFVFLLHLFVQLFVSSYSYFLSLHPLFFIFLSLCVRLISGILTSGGEPFVLWMMTIRRIPVSNGREHVHAA
jgi:hypothetical protein